MKLALGSVQFGMRYGAFNRAGQPALAAVRDVLDMAAAAGIGLIDTASAYGDSEAVLGRLAAPARFGIITKVPPLDGDDPVARLEQAFRQSLARLGAGQVQGLLLHRAGDLLGPAGDAIWQAMQHLRAAGLVGQIGVSGYGPDEMLTVLDRYPVGLVQLPFNVFDHRHRDAGVLARCARDGVMVHTRSAFLQGFALADPDRLEGHLAGWRPLLQAFRARCDALGLTPLQAALRHVLDQAEVGHVVIGVDDVAQLRAIIAAAAQPLLPADALAGLQSADAALIDPSRWP